MRLGLLTIGAVVILSTATASAQTAATCSFIEGTATLTVTLDGQNATIQRTGPGQIRLNGVDCTGATVTTTDTIVVTGGPLADTLTITGSFVPGLTPEEVGGSEIEWSFALGAGTDRVRVNGTSGPDVITFTSGGIDVGNDGDEDITLAGVEQPRIYPLDGDDLVDATLYTGGGNLYVYGGNGMDTVEGSPGPDLLYGQADSDSLFGGDGIDRIYGGTGDDFYYGEGGNDLFFVESVADGADTFEGGEGTDTLSYAKRAIAVSVTIDGVADDGEAGELDNVLADVENVTGGAGNDVMVGSAASNKLAGNGGNDTLSGGSGRDIINGGGGDDTITGDIGPDELYGDSGLDTIDGGTGNDAIFGGAGADTLTGGGGADSIFGEGGNDVIFNDDGIADTVDCGLGAQDDAEADPLDTLISCEI